jgi:hypothetical protein
MKADKRLAGPPAAALAKEGATGSSIWVASRL